MRKIIILGFVAVLGGAATAQTRGGALYMMPGIQRFQFSSLDGALAQAGFAETPVSFGKGFGGFGSAGNWRLGGEGTYFSGQALRGQNTTLLSGGMGYFYGAYVWQQGPWRIVPAAVPGFGGLVLSAVRATTVATAGELLGSQPNSSTLSMGDVFVHTSLGIERPLSQHMFIALRGAYHLGIGGNKPWNAEGFTAVLHDAFRSFQINLNVGFVLR